MTFPDLARARFASNVLRLRKEASFTQEVLADRSALSTTMIVKIEKGNLLPGFEVVIRMAAALLTTPSALVDGITWKPGRVLETDPQDYTLAEDESGDGS
ncbi:MAG TPA: helix-turn-helix transcriptional regulator [Candidatus Dormibacteraeota bacterium]